MTAENSARFSPEHQAALDEWAAATSARRRQLGDRLFDDDGTLPPLPPTVTPIWTIQDYADRWPNGLGKLLLDSAISIEVADARGYEVISERKDARGYGFSLQQARRITAEFAALLVPIWDVQDEDAPSGWQLRPSQPETSKSSRKYETPRRQANFLDVNPTMRGKALDCTEPLWITEGARKVDALATLGVPCVGLSGVWNWKGRERAGDPTSESRPLPQWKVLPLADRVVVICFDSDAATNKGVRSARRQLAKFLMDNGAKVEVVHLPMSADGAKQGVDDYIGAGGKLDDLLREPWSDQLEGDGRPMFRVDNAALVYDNLERELGGGTLYGFFIRHGVLVHVPLIGEDGYEPPADGDDGPAQVRQVSPTYLRGQVQSRCYVCRENRHGEIEQVLTPQDPFRQAVEVAGTWKGVPVIDAVSHTPLMRADGTILSSPGYDLASRTLLLPDAGLQMTVVPDVVDDAWVSTAVDALEYLLCDFPFEDAQSKANMLALLITPVLRLVVPSPYPLVIMNAHQPGSGKTKLATIAAMLHGGVHRPELPQHDEELRKQVTGILASTTAPVVVWDNADATIKSPILASLLTSARWDDRLLGTNKDISARNDRVWITTGNNVQIGGDMERRCYWVSLDPGRPDPERRDDFREMDLEGYVATNRGRLLTALLVIARRWVQDGMPKRTVRSDSYGNWAGAMAELLSPFGLTDAFCSQTPVEAVMSTDDAELGEFLSVWYSLNGDKPFQARNIEDRCTKEPLGALSGALPTVLRHRQLSGDRIAKSMGRYLQRNSKRYASGLRVVPVEKDGGPKVWQVERAR